MSATQDYRDLIVWQKASSLAIAILNATDNLPPMQQFGLISQMQKSAVSIASNIAEGRHRHTRKDYIHFLYIAYASAAELATQIHIAKHRQKMSTINFSEFEKMLREVMKMLNSMISHLKAVKL